MLAISTMDKNLWGRDEQGEGFLAGYDFTNRVRGALIKARDEAHRRNHLYVGPEHLLIGLLAAFVPYLVMRGLAARAARRWRGGESAGETR